MNSFKPALTARKRALAPKLALAIIGASFAFSAQAQNFIQNPGFETTNNANPGTAPPWTFGGNTGTLSNFNNYAHTGEESLPIAGIDVFVGGNTVLNGSAMQTVTVPVAGTYIFSFYEAIRTSGGNAGSDRLVASFNGVNSINAVFANAAFQQVSTQVVLAAGASSLVLQGTFLTGGPNFYNFLSLDDFSLTLLMAVAQNLTLTPNLVGLAQTQNQRAVAAGLTNAFNNANLGTITAPNGVAGAVVTALNNTNPAAIPGVLDSLSGEGITATQNLAHREAELFTSSIFDQTTFYGSDHGGANQIVLTAPQPGSGFVALAPADQMKVQPIRELADLPSSRPAFIAPVAVAPTRTWRAWGSGFGGDEEFHSNPVIGFAAQSTRSTAAP